MKCFGKLVLNVIVLMKTINYNETMGCGTEKKRSL